jgi:phospholipase/carboxylesterase
VNREPQSGLEFLVNAKGAKKAVILFHGYGASMQDLYGLSEVIATNDKWDWIFPDGPISVPLGMFMEGRAWFPIDMRELEQAMMKGEFRNFEDKCPPEFLKAQDLATIFTNEMMKKYDDVVIGGFSQGAMIATHLLTQNIPVEKLKGGLFYSTTLLAKDKLMAGLEGKKPIPFLQSHGKSDQLLDYNVAMKLFELLKLYRFEGEFISFNGGHEIPMNVITKSAEFLDGIRF